MLREFYTHSMCVICAHALFFLISRRPCNELGLQRILQEFEKAADLLDSGYTFQQVCQLA